MSTRIARSLLHGDVPSRLPVPGLRAEDIAVAHMGLERFERELSPDEQEQWRLSLPRDARYAEPDDGVISRTREDGDRKIFLHFRPDLAESLLVRGVGFRAWQAEWLLACERIWCACDAAMTALARDMDDMRADLELSPRLRNPPDDHCLRVLRYRPKTGSLAHPHTDRCAVTFRIAESHPGFYIGKDSERRFYEAPPTPEVDCFTGDQFAAITGGAVPATWHGADDMTGGSAERWAVVFFGKIAPA